MSESLANKECVACKGGIPPLRGQALEKLQAELSGGWTVEGEHHLSKTFIFKNFVSALGFVNQIGDLAESQGHHPDLYLSWGKVRADIWTHKIDGLTESDFILAAKIDKLSH
ncbi:MAG: 4a-hydroxytetrahydrobiopterin dehydratase [Myxococcota bacterium]